MSPWPLRLSRHTACREEARWTVLHIIQEEGRGRREGGWRDNQVGGGGVKGEREKRE